MRRTRAALIGAPRRGHPLRFRRGAGPRRRTARTRLTTRACAQLASEFGLRVGTAINVDALSDPQYKQIAATQFSTVTAENVMKWETLEPTRGTYNWGPAEQFMAFAKANHQQVRGHVLVWSNQLPQWLTQGVADGSISDAELRGILEKHIKTVVNHFKGRIWQWDVVNEAVTDSWDSQNGAIGYKGFWYQHLGQGYIADSFRWARQADPKALLFYNDYNIDAFGDRGPLDKTEFVYQMVKSLRPPAFRWTASAARATCPPATATTRRSRSLTPSNASPGWGWRQRSPRSTYAASSRKPRPTTRSTPCCRRRRTTTARCSRAASRAGTASPSRCGASTTVTAGPTPGTSAVGQVARRWPRSTTSPTSRSRRTVRCRPTWSGAARRW